MVFVFFFSSRRRHTRCSRDWSSDVCSSDLYHMLPGYPAAPLQGPHPTLTDYLEKTTPKGGYWVNNPKFVVSLLKAWWGPAATTANDYAYDYLPKREKADAYSHQHFVVGMYEKKVKGFICMGQNPAVDSPNAKMARQRSEEHTSELQSRLHLVCRLLLEKKKK